MSPVRFRPWPLGSPTYIWKCDTRRPVRGSGASSVTETDARFNFRYATPGDIFLVSSGRRMQESGALGERTLVLKVMRMLAFQAPDPTLRPTR